MPSTKQSNKHKLPIHQRVALRLKGFDANLLAEFVRHASVDGYSSGALSTWDEKQAAKSIVTRRYLLDGVVREEDTIIDEKGRRTHKPELDTSHDHSVYFGVKNDDDLVMTARLILPHPQKGFASFHLNIDDLYEEARKEMQANGPSKYMEFSSYGRAGSRDTYNKTQKYIMRGLLLREMLQFSWLDERADGKTWLFGLRAHLVPTYKKLFGESMKQVGAKVGMRGLNAEFVPFTVDLTKALVTFINQARHDATKRIYLRIFLGDLNEEQLKKIAKKTNITLTDLESLLS